MRPRHALCRTELHPESEETIMERERWTEDRLRTVIAARIQVGVPTASVKRSLETAERILQFFRDEYENAHDCGLYQLLAVMNNDASVCFGYCQED